MTVVGTKLPLRSDTYDRIEAVVIDAFAHGRAYTQRALARAMAQSFGVDENDAAERMVYYLRQLAERGIYEAQAGRFGSKGTQAKGSPTSPRWFNWSDVPVEQATLGHALEPYLNDVEVPEWRKVTVRKALRFKCGLPTQCGDTVLLAAAARIPGTKLYELPQAVHAEAAERFQSQTAKNYRSAMTDVLAYAARRRLIPMVFPYFVVPDAWAEFTDRYFPLTDAGESPRYVKRHRNGMSYIRRAAVALYGDDVTPGDITRERAEEIAEYLGVTEGKRDAVLKARGTMRELAHTFQTGPFVEQAPTDQFLVRTRHGLRPVIYLRGADDACFAPGWEGFLQLLAACEFPNETIDYLRWYGVYITMSPRELMKRENRRRYPDRQDAHRLSPNSLARRIVALRAYLGAAVNVLGMKPGALTPDVVFGTGFDEIAHTLADWWHDRREARRAEGGDTAIAGALGHYIVSVGMVCYTRYELLRFNRRLSVAVIERMSASNPSDRTVRIDTVAEEGVAKTPQEQAAWDAYRQAYALENKLQAMVKEERGANQAGEPEFKDLKEMMANTPPQWFITILERCTARVREGIRKNDQSMTHHKLVRDTVDLAFHISTGCRSEESCLIRVDTHLAPERLATRVVRLLAEERKNNREHEVLLQPAYLPDDILMYYLEHTRPYLMRDQYLRPHRVGGRGPKVTRPERVQDHPFFLVTTRGTAYGVLDLQDPEQVLYLAQRAEAHGRNLTTFLAREAVRCKLKLPGRKYELGPHAIRGVFAYALYVMTRSAQMAAHYLGDQESTVASNYSAISGVHVDSSALIGFNVGPQVGAASLAADTSMRPTAATAAHVAGGHDAGEATYLAKMEALLSDRRSGFITQAQCVAMAAAYERQYRTGRSELTRLSAA